MEPFTLSTPTDLAGAIAAIGTPGGATTGSAAKFIAGGTDLVQLMKDLVEQPRHLVDLERLPLRAVELAATRTRIGALATMSDVADDAALAARHPLIAQALLASAAPQLRNMATIGGNMLQRTRCVYFRNTAFPCNKRVPGSGCPAIAGDNRMLAIFGGSALCVATHPSDLAVALVALDASLELTGPGGSRTVALADFHLVPGTTPQHETVLRPGEIITSVSVPAGAAGQRSHYLKVRDRASFEFALVSAAVVVALDQGRITRARVAMGGVGPKPWRLPAVEAALVGEPATRAAFTAAAAKAAEGAHALADNGFKIVLMQRALVRALTTATA
jgi:xanthine dehydrogenase YagS FAD-binding subunit